jgi:hypothetical protein
VEDLHPAVEWAAEAARPAVVEVVPLADRPPAAVEVAPLVVRLVVHQVGAAEAAPLAARQAEEVHPVVVAPLQVEAEAANQTRTPVW